MIEALIFDLDGLLTDTERLHMRAYQDVLRAHGYALSADEYARHWIRDGQGIADLIRKHALGLNAGQLRGEKSVRYTELVRAEAVPMPGARAVLERFAGRMPLALATASHVDAAEAVLATLELRGFFAAIVTGDSVPRAKPAPDVFLAAAARLAVPPANCLVLEDAGKGVFAARSAGMLCVAVPNAFTRHHDFSQATRVVGSLDEVTPEWLEALGAAPSSTPENARDSSLEGGALSPPCHARNPQ